MTQKFSCWVFIWRKWDTNSKSYLHPIFSAVLFIIAKTWKQPKLFPPSTDKWIKKMWYLYNGILFCHKIEGNSAIYESMDGPWGHFANWNKSEKEKCHMISLIRVILKKITTRPKSLNILCVFKSFKHKICIFSICIILSI